MLKQISPKEVHSFLDELKAICPELLVEPLKLKDLNKGDMFTFISAHIEGVYTYLDIDPCNDDFIVVMDSEGKHHFVYYMAQVTPYVEPDVTYGELELGNAFAIDVNGEEVIAVRISPSNAVTISQEKNFIITLNPTTVVEPIDIEKE